MTADINPFYARASEYIEFDDKFLNLFSPEILNLFNDDIWNKINIIRSSPGGGKTTLLKLFTPIILRKLKDNSKHDEGNREIYSMLKKLKVYADNGNLNIIGSLISLNNEYVSIDFLQSSKSQKIRIFLALINIRIVLSVLQSIYNAKEFSSVDDYKRLKFKLADNTPLPNTIRRITNGFELFNWACDQEELICREIDSAYLETETIEGTDNLYALDLLAPKNIFLDDEPMQEKILVMLDDVHNLSSFQRSFLVETIIQKRPLVNTWISERLKALTMDELFSEGSTEERDMKTIYLERLWASKGKPFERFAKSVANRRLKMTLDSNSEFATFLSEDFDADDKEKIANAQLIVEERVRKSYGSSERYNSWISSKENDSSDAYEKLVGWVSLEILLFRDKNKTQQKFDFEELREDELKDQEGSDVKTAAQLFINK